MGEQIISLSLAALLSIGLLLPAGYGYFRFWCGYERLISLAIAPLPVLSLYGICTWGWAAIFPSAQAQHGRWWIVIGPLISLLVLVIVVFGARLTLKQTRGKLSLPSAADKLTVVALGGGAALVLGVYFWASDAPAFPVLHQDAFYHYGLASHALDSGSISAWCGSNPVRDVTFQCRYYPTLIASLVSLSAYFTDAVSASTAVNLLAAAFWLPLILIGITRALQLPYIVQILTALLAGSLASFPTFQAHLHGQFAFAFSVYLLTASILAFLTWVNFEDKSKQDLAVARNLRRRVCPKLWAGIGVLIGLVATAAAQPGTIAGFLVFLYAYLFWMAWKCWQGIFWARIGILVAALGGIEVVVWLVNLPVFQSFLRAFPRPGGFAMLWLKNLFTGAAPFSYEAGTFTGNLLYPVLLISGFCYLALVAYRSRKNTLWAVLSLVLGLGIFVGLAAGSENRYRALTVVWYRDPDRVMALLTPWLVILIAAGAYTCAKLISRLVCLPALLGALSVVLALGATGLAQITPRAALIHGGQHPEDSPAYQADLRAANLQANNSGQTENVQIKKAEPIASLEKWQKLRSFARRLRAEDVVVGDPLNGSLILQAYSPAQVIPALVQIDRYYPREESALKLVNNLDSPHSCQQVRELGLTYILSEAGNGSLYGKPRISTDSVGKMQRLNAGSTNGKPQLKRIIEAGSATVWSVECRK